MNNSLKLLSTGIALMAIIQICYSQNYYTRSNMLVHKNNRHRFSSPPLQRKFNNELGRVSERTRSNDAIYISKRRDRVSIMF